MDTVRLHDAYRYCQWLTYHHYENFPVASWLLPKAQRPTVAAIYAFARSADDFSDEAKYRGRSLKLLTLWRKTLAQCAAGNSTPLSADEARGRSGFVSSNENHGLLLEHPIFLALADSIQRCRLPVQLLDDLLTAFLMDVTKDRYATWEELMTYCRYSANPVGRLVLTIFGYVDPELHRLSDQICTALQLANHWQDLSIDCAKDRLYIPHDLLTRHGVTVEELKKMAQAAREGREGLVIPQFRLLMAELVERARAMFDAGEPLLREVTGRFRVELKLTLLGGRAILNRIEAVNYNVFRHRPVLSTGDKLRLLGRAIF